MRAELTTLEKIDRYLAGNMSPDELSAFSSELSGNPELQAQVEQQQELIRALNRKILRSQINTIAAGAAGGVAAGGFSKLFLGISSVVVVGAGVTAAVYFSSGEGADNTFATDDKRVMNVPENVIKDSVRLDPFAYDIKGDVLIMEQPETIFSSVNNYEEEKEEEVGDKMSVTVNFQSRGERTQINNSTAGGTGISEEPENQEINVVVDDNEVVNRSMRASFPGGNPAMKKFMDKNLRYPKSARDKSIEGVVRCDFEVTADGLIRDIDAQCIMMNEKDGMPFSDMRILMNKKIMNAFIGNATHILRTMPKWEPAHNIHGSPIISTQRMYFNYDLDRGCLVYQLDE